MKHFLRGIVRIIASFGVLLDPRTEQRTAAGDNMREILPPTLSLKPKLEKLGYSFMQYDDGWYLTRYPYAPDLGTYPTEAEAVEAAYNEALKYNDFRIALGVKPIYSFDK